MKQFFLYLIAHAYILGTHDRSPTKAFSTSRVSNTYGASNRIWDSKNQFLTLMIFWSFPQWLLVSPLITLIISQFFIFPLIYNFCFLGCKISILCKFWKKRKKEPKLANNQKLFTAHMFPLLARVSGLGYEHKHNQEFKSTYCSNSDTRADLWFVLNLQC